MEKLQKSLIILLISGITCWAQEYPFDGYGAVVQSITVPAGPTNVKINPVIFSENPKFIYEKFSKKIFFSHARFLDDVEFTESSFGGNSYFHSAYFAKNSDFRDTHFKKNSYFNHASFLESSDFRNARFDNTSSFIKTKFKNSVSFFGVEFTKVNFDSTLFDKSADFRHGKVKGDANFSNVVFADFTDFSGRSFYGNISFHEAFFPDTVLFSRCMFANNVNFSGVTFEAETNFFQTKFLGDINISNAKFKNEVDLRWADFSKVKRVLVDDNLQFPKGKFFVNWKDFANKIELAESDIASEEQKLREDYDVNRFYIIEKFYLQMKENFTAQNNDVAVDAVKYGLAKAEQKILGGFGWSVYGWVFGWGYKPWRFLFYVVIPTILIFSILWYKHYYEVIVEVFYTKENDRQRSSRLQRLWRSVHFSTSVLLSFRFKKDWIVDRRHFLHFVSLEWILGILLYILFALFVEGSRFNFIKGLFGFV